MSNSSLVNVTIKSPNCNSPRRSCIKKITIHHMAGNLSAERCGELFADSNREGSANYGIDSDGNVGLYVDEADRAWTSSSPWNDNQAVTIEVANDEYGGNWHVSDTAFNKLIDLCVDICERNGIPELVWTGDSNGSLTCHYMFAATACPGEYLKSRMPEIAAIVTAKLNGTYNDSNNYTYTSSSENNYTQDCGKSGFEYQVHTQESNWLPNVWNTEDYAGIPNQVIDCVYVTSTEENVYYQVHVLGGDWLPWVKNREDYAGIYGQVIDGIKIKTDRNNKDVLYRVSCTGEDYLPWVREDEYYAGIYGKSIDRLEIKYVDHGDYTTAPQEVPVNSEPEPQYIPENNSCSFNMTYKVYSNNYGWLPSVNGYNTDDNDNGNAGIYGVPISAIMINDGVHVKVHLKNQNRWLPDVTGYDENDYNNGYAGIINEEIDGIQIWSDNRNVAYQVSTIEHGWYGEVYGNEHDDYDVVNGFAGVFGETVDRVTCHYIF